MFAAREMTNKKSIFPLHPAGPGSPKSGMPPRSRTGSALPPPEPLSSVVVEVPELLELDEDPLDDPSDTLVIPGVVVGIFALHLVEIGLCAVAIAFASYALHLGRIVGDVHGTDLELLYFSAETFTTLGFGDIIPSGPMRLLCSFEPLNGLILLGWSASFIHLEVERYWRRPEGAPSGPLTGRTCATGRCPRGCDRDGSDRCWASGPR